MHNMIHTGEKPFECRQCEMKFTITHVKTNGPHECENCGKRYVERGALLRHWALHHGDGKKYE
jgi:predicted RNA-binding Zn-ribbon protein involved in translation (DUF1610 family)